MTLPFKIVSISTSIEVKLKEKGSEFIAHAYPIETMEEATNFLNTAKKKYYDATHNCYAYKFADGTIKYSDDGEPNGTAGIRILNAINHFNFVNVIVIVTRYFGGTKLGVGPLGKAYYDSAAECLSNCKTIEKNLMERLSVKFDFEYSNLVHRLLTKYSCIIEKTSYADNPEIHFIIESSRKEKFINDILSSSLNRIIPLEKSAQFYR